jgi:methylaspartate ammonia-lyase
MEQKLLNALVAHYSAQIQVAEANLLVHFKSPAGVGEHPDAVANMVGLVSQVAHARGALQVLTDMVQQAQPEGEGAEGDPAPPVSE